MHMMNFFRLIATVLLAVFLSSFAFAAVVPSPRPDHNQPQTQFQQYMETKRGNPKNPNAPHPPEALNTPQAQLTPPQQVQQQPPSNPFIVFPPKEMPTEVPPPPGPNLPIVGEVPLTYEQSKQAMLHEVPKSILPPDPDAEVAFDSMLRQNMPLSPDQVVKLRQSIDTEQRAASIPAVVPPKPVSTTLMINLAPGTTPPAIRLAQGYVSSLVFVDSTGAPWPIASFDIGNPNAMNLQWDGKSNILLLQSKLPYSDGNIVLRLVGLLTPITLELVSGQRVVDYRVDIHVSGIGPNTKDIPMGADLPNSADQLLLSVLDGVAPAGSRTLYVRGADAQAWLLGEKIYLRTQLTVLSPGWIGKMVSPDGMQAYQIPRTSSVLVSRYGEPVELKIEGL